MGQATDDAYSDRMANYSLFSAAALYFYDCLLMLSTEKDGVWKDFETSVASLTFLVNRYGWFAFMVTEVSITMRWDSWTTNIVSCYVLLYIDFVFGLVSRFANQYILVLRIYAIYGRRRGILAICLVPVLARTAVLLVECLKILYVDTGPGLSRCGLGTSDLVGWYDVVIKPLIAQGAISALTLAFDALVFLLTVAKTYNAAREAHQFGATKSGLFELILRDGTIYYLIVLLVGSLDTTSTFPDAVMTSLVTPYFNMLPSLLTSRLFLNLKSYTKTKPGFTTISRSIPSLAFAGAGGQQQHDRILGNIGAPLRTWFDDDDDEVELEESAADELSGAAPCDEETGGREVEIVPVVYGTQGTIEIVSMAVEGHSTGLQKRTEEDSANMKANVEHDLEAEIQVTPRV
ncbi:uncharacterized protein STEHIDRAFT_152905 [Stereum hirsutum FP-91666 SS1]|uniref:uncharacterized protein n=1 Tax=Stereum hirsutum (strain FP-91666) TaxID=721885 RepID=UPI000440C7D9|nr:uncharacterized protein STEHIDRAFT_152905 [Stereum hirsutum FP-91666 SS1]EIM91253.1 hypothetical protein STEHIDRAFT_152905 [Stereum hirsutum FP-91666 SS1]